MALIAPLSQRVETKIPGFERASKLRRVGFVGRQVRDPHFVDFVTEQLQAIRALEVERVVALRPENLWDDRREAHDDQVGQGNGVDAYR
ncbi:MAG: hypothetical protein DRH30_11205 [Deltaproteobacteria bacterium]|nr:MAG: hypothetical protein DRH30_11205 [Deltaproteobacteria bacterium]